MAIEYQDPNFNDAESALYEELTSALNTFTEREGMFTASHAEVLSVFYVCHKLPEDSKFAGLASEDDDVLLRTMRRTFDRVSQEWNLGKKRARAVLGIFVHNQITGYLRVIDTVLGQMALDDLENDPDLNEE